MIVLLAAMAFGPLAPPQSVEFADGTVRAEARYRLARDVNHSKGEDRWSPSIASGTLTFTAAGRTHTYSLAALLPTNEGPITLAASPSDSCGAAAPILHRNGFLAVEAVVGAKGCAPIAAFIDVATGAVAESVVLDPTWHHRFDAVPERFAGKTLTVSSVTPVDIVRSDYDFQTKVSTPTPWHFVVVRARGEDGRAHWFSYERTPGPSLPTVGERVTLGNLLSRHLTVVTYFQSQRVLHLDAADDARFAAAQTPTPANVERISRRNSWFQESMDEANAGNFDGAVVDYGKMVALERDDSLLAGERETLRRCLALEDKVHAKTVSAASASAAFINAECKLPSP